MKNKVGRPKGITQTEKKIKLDNELIEYWEATKNKNRMVNNAIKEYYKKQTNHDN